MQEEGGEEGMHMTHWPERASWGLALGLVGMPQTGTEA